MAFIERAWPRTKGMSSQAQRSASQVPGEEAFHADDEILPVGGNGLQKWFRCRFHMPVKEDLAGLVQDAEVHGAGVQVDPAVTLVWLGVEAPEVSSSPWEFFPVPAYHRGMRRRGPQ
jgi:hypothetical protein